jgi:CheY-like chemotaxis protein
MVQEAQAASRAKTTFLAVTSHEIRTPLNAVLGLAQALERTALDGQQQDLLAGILDSGAMLLRLLNAVLDIAKVENGGMTLAETTFDLAALTETVARIWRSKAEHDGVRLELAADGLSRPCLIHADAGKIEQTLVNLLSNALKFSPTGSTVRLTVSAVFLEGAVRVEAEVLDQGPGVAAEDQERIFQAYEQTEEGRRAGGAGLGLAICAANVRALGGSIGVNRPPEGGGRFFFTFDAGRAKPACMRPAAPQQDTSGGLPPLRLLAAEDNPANQRVLAVLMQPLGLTPTFVSNGAEALAAVETEAFDLILMDANMPVMDGATAVARIRALGGPASETPIHMVTANVFEEDIERYFAAGADGVLAKPIMAAELYALLMAPAGARRRAAVSARAAAGGDRARPAG